MIRKLWDKLEYFFGIPNKPAALPTRFFGKKRNEYTWEDWRIDAKKKYPIRFFIFEELDVWFRVKWMRYIDDPIYWVTSFVIRKDHLLDLRGAKVNNEYGEYKWGYTDPGNLIQLALFKSFEKYIEEINLNYGGIDKRIANLIEWYDDDCDYHGNDKGHIDHLIKVKEIYEFFTKELPLFCEQESKNLREWAELDYDDENKEIKFEEHNEFKRKLDEKTQEYLIEIIKQREFMWT